MNFDGGFQIKVGKDNVPLTDRGPVLASDGFGNFYMAYVGNGGKNLWMSYCQASDGNFQNWLGNEPVKPEGGKTLETKDRPALAYFIDSLEMVYVDHSSGKLMETFYIDGSWSSPVEVTGFQGIEGTWSQPILVTPGLTMYLLAIDQHGNPWYSYKTFQVIGGEFIGQWTEATMINRSIIEIAAQANVKYWTLSLYGNNIYLLGIEDDLLFIYSKVFNYQYSKPTPYDFTWFFKGSVQIPFQMDQWLSAIPIIVPAIDPPAGQNYTGFFYTSNDNDHNDNLYFIALDLNSLKFILATSSQLGSGESGTFKTTKIAGSLYAPILNSQSGKLYYTYCAYKGASNNNIYFAAGWGPFS